MQRASLMDILYPMEVRRYYNDVLLTKEKRILYSHFSTIEDNSNKLFEISDCSIFAKYIKEYGNLNKINLNNRYSTLQVEATKHIEEVFERIKSIMLESGDYDDYDEIDNYDIDLDSWEGELYGVEENMLESVLGYDTLETFGHLKFPLSLYFFKTIQNKGIKTINNKALFSLDRWIDIFIELTKNIEDNFYGMLLISPDQKTILNIGHPLVALDILLNKEKYNLTKYFGLVYNIPNELLVSLQRVSNYSPDSSKALEELSFRIIEDTVASIYAYNPIALRKSKIISKVINSILKKKAVNFSGKTFLENPISEFTQNMIELDFKHFDREVLKESSESNIDETERKFILPITSLAHHTYIPYYGIYVVQHNKYEYVASSLTPFLSGNIQNPAYTFRETDDHSLELENKICTGKDSESIFNVLNNSIVNTRSMFCSHIIGANVLEFKNACLEFSKQLYGGLK